MSVTKNEFRAENRSFEMDGIVPYPSIAAERPVALLGQCPKAAPTPLHTLRELAGQIGIADIYAKDESGRMGLGSFKALGAAYVIAYEARQQKGIEGWESALSGYRYVTASAGNHGLSVAAGARLFGAKAVIYLSKTVPESFATRLRSFGAEVRREGQDYEASMRGAEKAAASEGLTLLSDSSWPGYFELPHRLMEGYLVMGQEISDAMDAPPSHIFLQAGVGGMAGALAAHFRNVWGDEPIIVVVEPDAAPALKGSIEAGKFFACEGPVSNMGRLDCKQASLIGLKGLAQDADYFVTISDQAALDATDCLRDFDMISTPSGAAGLAALMDEEIRMKIQADDTCRALIIMSEGSDG